VRTVRQLRAELPPKPSLLALSPVPTPLATDKPVAPARERFAADDAVPLRRRMLETVALSPLSVLTIAVAAAPASNCFPIPFPSGHRLRF
jgi:hypothetical protein